MYLCSDYSSLLERQVKIIPRDVADIIGRIQLRTNFACGSFGNPQKVHEFFVSSTLETLSNIRANAHGRPLNLVFKAIVFGKRTRSCKCIDILGQLPSQLPNLYVLISFKRSQSLNLKQ